MINFEETQRFPGWVMAMVILAAGASIGVFLIGFYVQLVRGEPWGNNPMNDGALLGQGAVFILLGAGLIWLFATLRLITEVQADSIQVRFAPMRPRRIPMEQIVAAEVRELRPIRDFGGWGLRYGRGTKAYLARGSRGVYLRMASGRDIVIGSQQPEELEAAIRTWLR